VFNLHSHLTTCSCARNPSPPPVMQATRRHVFVRTSRLPTVTTIRDCSSASAEICFLKELLHGLRILKFSLIFLKVRRLQSVLIFSILNHPCSIMVYYYLCFCFSILVNYYFQVSFNSKAFLYLAKINQSTITEIL